MVDWTSPPLEEGFSKSIVYRSLYINIYIHICYIHPELRTGDYRSGSGKGAGLL